MMFKPKSSTTVHEKLIKNNTNNPFYYTGNKINKLKQE